MYVMESGKSTSFEDDLGETGRHVAAVRDKNVVRLYLYIDGVLNSSSTTFAEADYDISNRSQFLMGFGPMVFFHVAWMIFAFSAAHSMPAKYRNCAKGCGN